MTGFNLKKRMMACVWSLLTCLHPGTVFAHAATGGADTSPFVIRIDTECPSVRVYLHGHLYRTYAAALGKEDTETPIGSWHIVDKQRNWGGGFGTRWMGLDVPWGTYGIHGTNRPSSIGGYASNGCVRLRNPDVEQLYELIPLGTPVVISGNPLKHLRVLRYGNIGADVQLVQRKLQQAGFFHGPCNGRFDGRMQFGLFYYQLARNIPATAAVGMADYRALGLVQ